MSKPASQALFALVESFFTGYLPRQRGASVHTIRAYRDSLKLLFEFTAQHHRRDVASLDVADLDADAIAAFLDHIETNRSNSAITRNCRRAALRSFFKHLVRNDLTHSLQYTRVLAIPAKRARQLPATYLEADDVRGILAKPNRRTADGWRDYTLLLFLYNCGARVSEATSVRWTDLQLVPPRQVRLFGKGKKERLLPLVARDDGCAASIARHGRGQRPTARLRQPARSAADSRWHCLDPAKTCGSCGSGSPRACAKADYASCAAPLSTLPDYVG